MEIDEEKIDEAVLALLYLTTFKDKPNWRAWKGHNWDSLDLARQGGLQMVSTSTRWPDRERYGLYEKVIKLRPEKLLYMTV